MKRALTPGHFQPDPKLATKLKARASELDEGDLQALADEIAANPAAEGFLEMLLPELVPVLDEAAPGVLGPEKTRPAWNAPGPRSIN